MREILVVLSLRQGKKKTYLMISQKNWVEGKMPFTGHAKFFAGPQHSQSYYQQLMGLNKTQFSHVINGEVERVPPGVWINTVNFLRSKLKENIREFQKNLGMGPTYFIQTVDQLPHCRIKRFQH